MHCFQVESLGGTNSQSTEQEKKKTSKYRMCTHLYMEYSCPLLYFSMFGYVSVFVSIMMHWTEEVRKFEMGGVNQSG